MEFGGCSVWLDGLLTMKRSHGCEMPLSQVLDKLRDDGQLFWRRDPDFVPEKDKRTVRLFLSSPRLAGKFW
jgi:hypothetical protein